jgi:hypothetical protein
MKGKRPSAHTAHSLWINPMTEDKQNHLVAADFAAGSPELGQSQLHVYGTLPENHPFYTIVGRVTSEMSHLEHVLDEIIWKLSGLNPALASCITSQLMGAAPRFRAIIALGKFRKVRNNLIESAVKLMQRTFDIAEQRNRLTHDPWYIETTSGQPAQFKSFSFKDEKYGIHEIDPSEIDKLLVQIRERIALASKLRDEISSALQPSP